MRMSPSTFRHITDLKRLRLPTCLLILVAISSVVLLGCGDSSSNSEHQTGAPEDQTPSTLHSVWDQLNGTWSDASKAVQDSVSPHAASLQNQTKEEVEKLFRWEYRVVDIPLALSAEETETQLAVLGSEGWECAAVIAHGENSRYTFKRRPRSALNYLKYIPGL